MRVKFIIIGCIFAFNLLLQTLQLQSQNPIDIIHGAYLKCSTVQKGYLESTRCIKLSKGEDTTFVSYRCHFSRLGSDSIYCRNFHCMISFGNDTMKGDALYTGKDFIYTNPKDSTAIIRSSNIWAEDLRRETYQYNFFEPLISCKSFPFLDETGKLLNGSLVSYLGNESIHQLPCKHIQINRDSKNFPEIINWRVLSKVYDYWINISDSIPIQYSISSKILIVNDTINQYEKFTLNKYDLNQALNDSIFTLKSIPTFYKIRSYSVDEPNQLLSTDSIAPEWSLTSLNDEKISLSNYRGKVVLLDFFYQSCYPCRLAIPELISLYVKYKEKGLIVIGIDPTDKRDKGNWNELTTFLSKRQVNYPILLDDGDVARKYKVHGYPTIYLIDKNGKIKFSVCGYSYILHTQLEDLISKAL